ncbi:MAG: hypothetical protein IJU59_01510 [Firmicutes bacterium]|jgi:hypothetical protein|nr:hypothetical protein [Bacillota bacterium]
MKDCIVLMASITLGVFIYALIAGSGDGTVISAMSDAWREGLDARNVFGV